ncbi:MAG TPA: ABC transporter substrate-binding protein [Bacillota bacterium]|nr:ABC transporter substrate-binding protein [Bacillota bacterium]
MKKVLVAIMMFLLGISLLTGCSAKKEQAQEQKKEANQQAGEQQPNKPLQKVTVLLDWVPNTNHTGLYVAKEQGYFKDQGLDVEIIQPSQGGVAGLVANGQAQFGISYQEEVTMARLQKVPIVSVAAVIQHNTSAFAAKKQSHITRPKDFEGKRYGGFGSPTENAVIEALMRKDGGDVKKVQFINMGSADFLASVGKNVDFSWIFMGWDGVRASMQGVALDAIMVKDADPALDYYTPVIITGEKLIKEKPEVIKAFMAAVSKGYQFAIAKPDEAAKMLVKNAPETDAKLAVESQKWLASQYQAEAPRWGEQKLSVWQGYADWMGAKGLLQGKLEGSKAYTNEFLPAAK